MSSVAFISGSSAVTSNGVTEVVAIGDEGNSTGSLGSALSIIGGLENRTVLVDKPLAFNRPAVAWLPIRGFESLWGDFDLGAAASIDDCVFPMTAAGVCVMVGRGTNGLETNTMRKLKRPCRSADPWSAGGDTRLHVYDAKGLTAEGRTLKVNGRVQASDEVSEGDGRPGPLRKFPKGRTQRRR
jgi:hypothetical protein